jgi:hypothetical protein
MEKKKNLKAEAKASLQRLRDVREGKVSRLEQEDVRLL